MKLWRNAAGKLIRGGDGKLVRCDACPCCPDVPTLTVTISGVLPCAGCFSYGDGSRFRVTDVSEVNAVHTVSQTAPGVFGWSIAGLNMTIERFSDPDCLMSLGTEIYTGTIAVTCDAALFSIGCNFTGGGATVTAFAAAAVTLNVVADSLLACSNGDFVESGTASVEL